MSSAVEQVNKNAEHVGTRQALLINTAAATGLQAVLATNLGPKGTLKMLVGGAGQIKLTKDGNTLLHEMQIQHPTATLIARTATATDETAGDGSTSTVIFTGELLKQASRLVTEFNVHPRVIVDGFDIAKAETLKFINEFKHSIPDLDKDREQLCNVCRTTLSTKLRPELVEKLTDIAVDAVLTIRRSDPNLDIDLYMVEIMHMLHKFDFDTQLVKGLVLDHGARHPAMPKMLKNVFVMILNVSLEYEKSEVTSNFMYSSAEQREKLVAAERKFTDDKVKQIILFKKELFSTLQTLPNSKATEYGFMIINQKGIDPISLDMLAREGILGLRRAKRRNMERLSLFCGGQQLNSVDDLFTDASSNLEMFKCLGFCEKVYEQTLGEDKFTFVEGVNAPNPLQSLARQQDTTGTETEKMKSVTILVKGQNEHTIAMVKDAVRDALRAVKNAMSEKALLPGAGAFEVAAWKHLKQFCDNNGDGKVVGKVKLGVETFADSLLVIPRTLIENSGFDTQEMLLKLKEGKVNLGFDVVSGEVITPESVGIWDNVRVKQSVVHLSTILASQLLLVDEIMKAGRGSRPKEGPNMEE